MLARMRALRTCVRTCVRACVRARMRACVRSCVRACFACVCVRACMRVHACARARARVCACIACVCVYVCTVLYWHMCKNTGNYLLKGDPTYSWVFLFLECRHVIAAVRSGSLGSAATTSTSVISV